MSHCYSVGVNIDGKEQEVCTIVPGNEDLGKHVYEAEKNKTKPRNPTKEEINRAIEYHFKNHKHEEKSELEIPQQDEMQELVEDA